MKIDDVLADDVVNLRLGIVPVGVKIPSGVSTKFLGGSDVPYRGIEPDVEIFILLTGDFEAKVRAIAAHVPVPQPFLQPGLEKIPYLGLQAPWGVHPLAQKRFIGTQRKEIVHRLAHHRRGAADSTAWILQVRRIVRSTAHLTDVAVLVSGPALGIGAGAANEAIGQKPRILLAVILCYRARHDMTLLTQ